LCNAVTPDARRACIKIRVRNSHNIVFASFQVARTLPFPRELPDETTRKQNRIERIRESRCSRVALAALEKPEWIVDAAEMILARRNLRVPPTAFSRNCADA